MASLAKLGYHNGRSHTPYVHVSSDSGEDMEPFCANINLKLSLYINEINLIKPQSIAKYSKFSYTNKECYV